MRVGRLDVLSVPLEKLAVVSQPLSQQTFFLSFFVLICESRDVMSQQYFYDLKRLR